MFKTPVLYLIFNRPELINKTFEAIRLVQPQFLYIAGDGPRDNKTDDKEKCRLARNQVVNNIDWPCEVKTLFRDKNLGCRNAVSTAIDWFFECEEEGIIIEDDCILSNSWFRFAAEMLEIYRDDNRIMCISASHFHGNNHKPDASYFFSCYNHYWGWASWRRAWKYYDKEMKYWPQVKETAWLLTIGNGDRQFEKYWNNIFQIAYEDKLVDSWAYRWTFSCWIQNGLTVLPSKNLMKNIGFSVDATHTKKENILLFNSIEQLTWPLKHPEYLIRDFFADKWMGKNVFNMGVFNVLLRKFNKVIFLLKRKIFLSYMLKFIHGKLCNANAENRDL